MHQKLANVLEKKGISDLTELTSEEKADFDRWDKVLSEGEITIVRILEFCKQQIKLIELKWRDLSIEQSKKSELIAYHTVYSTLADLITVPKSEKENLEKYLNQLLQS